ncbi:MAG: acyltransferase [Clostridia bacterium]|nr:acyltransferase [Clostridia bacterium]
MKKRDSGIELLRIIAMLMVIIIHAFLYGNFYSVSVIDGGFAAEIYTIIKMSIRPAVNIFLLITGYFSVKSDFNLKKSFSRTLNTYLRVWFYSAILTVIFLILGPGYCVPVLSETPMPVHKIVLKGLFPVTSQMWYYLGNYIILSLLIPFINITLKSITRKQYKVLLTVLTLLMCVFMTLLKVYPFNLWFNGFSFGSIFDGKNIFSFIYIYIIGGYIGLHSKKSEKENILYLYAAFACLIINYVLFTFLDPEIGYRGVSMNYSNPFVILQGVFMLLYFKDLHFHNKYVNIIGSTTLGVYAIHEYIFMRSLLWEKLFDFREMENFNFLTVLLISVAIFVVFGSVDLLVQKLFALFPKIRKIITKQ